MKKIVALLLCVGLILGAPYPRAANAANTLTRQLDPVVVLGGVMPDFAGVSLAQLFVYKYSGGVWSQIPWQFDEVVGSAIVSSGNGLLDAQDQLVFMAADAGDQAPAHAWLSDASATTYPRYELQVNDPLNATQHAWVYVYRSQTLASTIADYVSYDPVQVLLTSDRYQLGQLATQPAFDRLLLNGSGVDILDRTKIRVYVLFLPFTEDSPQLATTPPVLTRAGRVRVVLNGGGILAYRSFYVNKIHVETTLTPQSGRFSADMSSLASGSIYYDPNTPSTGVTIDGVPDTLTKSPAAVWSLVKVKTSAGFIGAIVRASDFSGALGPSSSATTFYRDNVTPESPDTGTDPGSYGDAGVTVTNPNQVFDFWSWNYILSTSELEPDLKVQGDKYNGYARNPLQVQATKNQPFTMSAVTIGREGASDVVLGWPSVTGADFYRVWFNPQPYFIPSGDPASDPINNDLIFTHTIAPDDLTNYYYVVRAVDTVGSDNFESVNSNRTGKFNFALVPGTG
jgi:hypothetical protein